MNEPWRIIAGLIDEARARGIEDSDAMTLATVNARGEPSARIVLCRGIGPDGLRFFTNYESRKASELGENARAALVFYWRELHRQVRVEGKVERLPAEDSDAYFRSRPRESQLGAWASPQSRPIETLDVVRARVAELEAEHAGEEVPRPPFWGGFRVVPHTIEFWTAGAGRIHDRKLFCLRGEVWEESVLAP